MRKAMAAEVPKRMEQAMNLALGLLGWLAAIALVAALFGVSDADAADAVAPAAAEAGERLTITDPFIELRTGPGRGFPVFFVAARDQTIAIELRHTDWFKVRTENGKVGWVERRQLESTLTAGGAMLKLWTSYRLSETLSLEGTIGQVQGVFSGTDFWHLNLLAEPWSDRRFSPFFGVGVGKFTNFPNPSLIGATTTDAKLANASLGARFYVSERFVLRADYTLYTAFVSDARSTEYHAFTAGLSFFF
jgi:uncharacterized protein YraI